MRLESRTKEELNLLIHIGIDTVKLDGKGFKSFVKSGQEVKAGDKLVEFDIDLIKKKDIAQMLWLLS